MTVATKLTGTVLEPLCSFFLYFTKLNWASQPGCSRQIPRSYSHVYFLSSAFSHPLQQRSIDGNCVSWVSPVCYFLCQVTTLHRYHNLDLSCSGFTDFFLSSFCFFPFSQDQLLKTQKGFLNKSLACSLSWTPVVFRLKQCVPYQRLENFTWTSLFINYFTFTLPHLKWTTLVSGFNF